MLINMLYEKVTEFTYSQFSAAADVICTSNLSSTRARTGYKIPRSR